MVFLKKLDWKSWIIYFLEGVKTQSIEKRTKSPINNEFKRRDATDCQARLHIAYSAKIVDYIITKPVFA